LELAEKGDVILDSWTMPWLLKEGFKIWLEVTPKERAKRIARRDRLSPEEALKSLEGRDARTSKIYERLYGFKLGEDFSPFNFVLDTNNLEAYDVFRVICMVLDHLYFETR
jgi:cytidylate kinase